MENVTIRAAWARREGLLRREGMAGETRKGDARRGSRPECKATIGAVRQQDRPDGPFPGRGKGGSSKRERLLGPRGTARKGEAEDTKNPPTLERSQFRANIR